MADTPNHGYNVPTLGTEDWHTPLNENFEALDADIVIRDTAANRDGYEGKSGALFLATDTGVVFAGTGSGWERAFALGQVESSDGSAVTLGPAGSNALTIGTDGVTVGGAVRADAVAAERVDSVQFAAAKPGASGAAKINAALADLPERGGTVFVGSNGPDTVGKESNVWAVDETITVDSGEWLVGAGPGWHGDDTGTALRATADVGAMVQFTGSYLNGVRDLRIDGTNTTAVGARLGDGAQNDFVLRNTMVHDATDHGVAIACQRNVWVDQCWIEQCGTEFGNAGIAVLTDRIEDTIWITECLFFGNYHDILFDHASSQTVSAVWITNMRTDLPKQHAIHQRPGAPIRDVWIVRPHVDAAGLNSSGAWDALNFAGEATAMEIHAPVVDGGSDGDGGSITRHAIHRESGTWTDCSISKLQTRSLEGSDIVGVVDSGETTRTLVNGWGVNDGDPSTTGQWNGEGREGVEVYDTTNDRKYAYVAGDWR